MYKEKIEAIRPEFEKALNYALQKTMSIRTGRANPALIENTLVDVFGSKMPIKQLASISVAGPKQLRVEPWDKSYIEPIARAIQANTSLSPTSDSNGVWINMPELTEEVRKDMIRSVGQIDDGAKQTIRKYRDEAWSAIQKMEKDGLISEDDKFRGKEELQKVVESYNQKIDNLIQGKKKELEV
ncbi:MAG: ribosome-recycling factor [Candidatus Pacebacteria bacterium]|nr:ribosome-recycling factor [Candidatus Paceibacterota bacterium]MDD3919095.1 ribosome-recycling factor [Candidatus Paceibacterota bacterium]